MASGASLPCVTFTRNRKLNCVSLGKCEKKRTQSDATVERLKKRVPSCNGWLKTIASAVVPIMVGSFRQLECHEECESPTKLSQRENIRGPWDESALCTWDMHITALRRRTPSQRKVRGQALYIRLIGNMHV